LDSPTRDAVVICPAGDNPWIAEHRLLGLTVDDRLLRTLERAGVQRIVFLGDGPRPVSAGSSITFVDRPATDADTFLLLAADTVLDPRFVDEEATIPAELPLRRLPSSEWDAAAAEGGEHWLARLGAGEARAGKGYALRVTDDVSARAAERALMLSLYKDQDGVISRHLNRKISTFISRRLARTSVRPNHVTAVVFLVGVCSGPLAYLGTYLGFAAGAFCYWFSAVLDGCDGELARLKYLGSPLGAWLDTVVDDLVCFSYVVGMYLALARGADHPGWLWLGAGGVAFYLLTILPRYYIMAARLGSGDYQKLAKKARPASGSAIARLALAIRDVIFRTDFLPFYALVTAAVGFVPAFAVPFALGSAASAVDTLITLATYRPQSRK